MAKLIPSIKLIKARELETLEQKYAALEAENQRLRTLNAELSKNQYGRQTASTSQKPALKLTTPSTPSYLKATVASKGKIVERKSLDISPSERPVLGDGQSPLYEDGKLISSNDKYAVPGYMKSTHASIEKIDFTNRRWAFVIDVENEARPVTPEEEPLSETELECKRCDDIIARYEEFTSLEHKVLHAGKTLDAVLTKDPLAGRTRLFDDFAKSPAIHTRIPFPVQSRILSSGLRLGQDIVFNAVRRHWPHAQLINWLEGPREVRLGYSELQKTFGGGDWATWAPMREINDICHHVNPLLNRAIYSLIDLRNDVCHQNAAITRAAYNHLYRVHRLAVTVGDEPRARTARALRDRLQVAAEKSYDEIDRLTHVYWDPVNRHRQWRLHHQRTFSDVIAAYNLRTDNIHYKWQYSRFPELLKAAAWDWHFAHGAPGLDNKEFQALIREAKVGVTRVPCKAHVVGDTVDTDAAATPRRASISGPLGRAVDSAVPIRSRSKSVGCSPSDLQSPWMQQHLDVPAGQNLAEDMAW